MNPVLVEVTRGGIVESQHRGAYCVVNGAGEIVLSAGDIDQPIFPRSSIKAIQALAMMETGAAEAFGFSADEIALCCASHAGEVRHVATTTSMLAKMGLSQELMQCGTHWPTNEEAGRHLAMEGNQPDARHNNCSGKHAGFLAYLKHCKVTPRGYVEADHPLQVYIREALEDLCDLDLSNAPVGIDGCAIPTWAVPLKNLALAFSKFAAPEGRVSADRQEAMQKITDAVFEAPFMIAGTGRYCTRLMEAFPKKVFVKLGAEGVYTAFVPERGIGIAIKCDDGAVRGTETTLSRLLVELDVLKASDFDHAGVSDLLVQPLYNRNGQQVGGVHPVYSQ